MKKETLLAIVKSIKAYIPTSGRLNICYRAYLCKLSMYMYTLVQNLRHYNFHYRAKREEGLKRLIILTERI